ncbi:MULTISPECIES: ABC transporter ATP-binding protein [Chromobacterium]|uniref:ABC transporter ATP-binding protein n=1 Tax=Chromobacterium TaxID=535 RepID=UPI000D30E26B|nr:MULTISPECIES: ABC transporter ATP-binding protein [Chromobacterium]MCP1293068.1 ABC transporter ATP-binding protein [Chromobacterium sp. S0633]PTU65249.1 ABC transporter ATP-binding protein [Chromobacterium sp. Panama]UJB30991.1 ABC transporter ATP-binding protein [Chromobacterium sp. Beijing]
MSASPAIVGENLNRSFSNGKTEQTVLTNISLSILPGELTLIIGPSGSGKSTLLSVLSGLLPPSSGRVTALGLELTRRSIEELSRFRLEHCGFVFQGFNLFASLTALENVLLPLNYGPKISKPEAEKRAQEALELVGLGPRAKLRPMELSGGEKQRVAIARALVKRPKLMFADEPTSALDSHNGQVVIDLLHQIAQEQGTTVLGVSHDNRLIKHADRVITLEDGQVVKDLRVHNTPMEVA